MIQAGTSNDVKSSKPEHHKKPKSALLEEIKLEEQILKAGEKMLAITNDHKRQAVLTV